jgi:hypothetical protein
MWNLSRKVERQLENGFPFSSLFLCVSHPRQEACAHQARVYRRVLGRPPECSEVREAVCETLRCLDKVSSGSTAESCLLFPMFTAGCELTSEPERRFMLQRFKRVESTGMTQVS